MPINIGSNFSVGTNLPIDERMVVANITARNAITADKRYEGLAVYVKSDSTNYQLVGGIADANWKLMVAPQSQTYTFATQDTWYRIAQSPINETFSLATFNFDWTANSGANTGAGQINVSQTNGLYIRINQTAYMSSNVAGIQKARVVYHTTPTGNTAFLEFYNFGVPNATVNIQMLESIGWTLLNTATLGNIPGGYTTKEQYFYEGISTTDQLVSTVIGKAPLFVVSGTKVDYLNVDQVDGYHAGNASGNIPISNGTLNTNLNADKLDDMHADTTNTASTIVARDTSGNFSAGTITAALSGNASTATKLATARTISLSNNVTGSATFDGSGNVNIAATVADNSHNHTSANISDATNANTANTVVKRDASGNFSAGTITAALSGNATTATSATTATHLSGGSAGTIPYQTAAGSTSQLAAGTTGQVLKSNGTSAPSWQTLDLTYLPDAAYKKSVKAATTANITLSAPQTIDGISVVAGDRVLVKDQTTSKDNGIYIVNAAAWTRASDADVISEIAGATVNVDSGTVNGGLIFSNNLKSTDTLGTTAMPWYRIYSSFDSDTANTVNKLVQRDTSGNFSAGTITATLSGNASTATKLATARTISLTGGVTGSASFDGSANASITATVTDNSHNHTSANISDATSANTASKIVARDASGNFSAGTITASLSGNATSATNIKGGSAGSIPYQTAADTTTQLAMGSTGQVLSTLNGTSPSWITLDLTYVPSSAFKKSVKAATTGSITLSGTQTVDGVALNLFDRVLVKDMPTSSQNGIYVVNTVGWYRAADADTIGEIAGAIVNVESGTVNGGLVFTNNLKATDTLNSTSMPWYRVYSSSDSDTANTANKLVTRDASGNFSAGTITATGFSGPLTGNVTGNVTGNASTATKLQTSRTISLTGGVTGSASFDGSANASITATVTNDSHSHSNYAPFATQSATTAATAGWYRIATSAVGIGANSGLFKVDFSGTGVKGRALFAASCHDGSVSGTNINQLGFTTTAGTLGLTKVRVVYHTTPASNYAYVEVYNPTALAITYTVDLIDTTGWTLVAPSTAGSIPGGYTNEEAIFDIGLVSNENVTAKGQLKSNIATGTSPMVITSTTKVDNLNADKLDDQEGSYYLALANQTGTISDTQHGSRGGGTLHAAATTSANGFMSSADKTKLDGIAAGAQTNQNAFSNVLVGGTTVAADNATDTLELVAGTNVVLTPDAVNDKVTIGLSASVETTTGAQTKATTAETNAKSYTDTKIAALVNSSPTTLDTLNELAAALGNDPNFATTMATELGKRTKKYSANVGDGVATQYTVTHSLNTKDLAITLEEVATGETCWTDILKVDANSIKLLFGSAPTANQFRVTVVG